jgi:hypothetical protein
MYLVRRQTPQALKSSRGITSKFLGKVVESLVNCRKIPFRKPARALNKRLLEQGVSSAPILCDMGDDGPPTCRQAPSSNVVWVSPD